MWDHFVFISNKPGSDCCEAHFSHHPLISLWLLCVYVQLMDKSLMIMECCEQALLMLSYSRWPTALSVSAHLKTHKCLLDLFFTFFNCLIQFLFVSFWVRKARTCPVVLPVIHPNVKLDENDDVNGSMLKVNLAILLDTILLQKTTGLHWTLLMTNLPRAGEYFVSFIGQFP